MHPTLEVRWFLQGPLPAEHYHWFMEESPLPIDSETREDWYLDVAKSRDLGIKLRQGNLEIKQRIGSRGVCKLAKQVRGRVETWVKWPFSIDAESSAAILSDSAQLWIPVHKSRWSRHYAITSTGTIEAVAASSEAEQGCSLELSDLQVAGQNWHSLCFETFGREISGATDLAQNLEHVVRHVVRQAGLPPLKARCSWGYPRWLQQIRPEVPQAAQQKAS
jgi:hypothetical protein